MPYRYAKFYRLELTFFLRRRYEKCFLLDKGCYCGSAGLRHAPKVLSRYYYEDIADKNKR